MSQTIPPPLKPIQMKDRVSLIFVSYGRIDVRDGAFVVVDEVHGERKHIPVGSIACIMMNRWLCGGHLWIFRVPLFNQVWTLSGILCHNNDRHPIASGLSPTHNHSRQWI